MNKKSNNFHIPEEEYQKFQNQDKDSIEAENNSFINFVKKLDLKIKTDFIGTDLAGISFHGNDLRDANFAYSELNDANFENANLAGANLNFAELNDVNFQNANLNNANLTFANLSGVNFTNTNVKDTRFGYNTNLSPELKSDLIQRGAIFIDSPGELVLQKSLYITEEV